MDCKPCMFSYQTGILQTWGAKRAENHFNGAAKSASGKQALARSPSQAAQLRFLSEFLCGLCDQAFSPHGRKPTAPLPRTTRTGQAEPAPLRAHTASAADGSENR